MISSDLKNQNIAELKFIRLPKVLEIIPVGKSTWWAGVKSGRFPKPIKLGIRTTAWRAADILNLIEELNLANTSGGENEKA